MEFFFEIHSNLPREGPGDNKSTKKAYLYLKGLPANICILDVGCGPGMQTIQLAKLINGTIIALDNHQPFLDELVKRAKKVGVINKIQTINKSMFSLDFAEESFHIIWSEGAVYIYGFENALKDWQKFLKSKGFFVVTEVSWLKENPPSELKDFWDKAYPAIKTIEENQKLIIENNYEMINFFNVPDSSWWDNYYHPLEKRISFLRK
ncbi:MAG: class I SAM-dependent methyltransferase [Promethearchaeota archaeon]